MTIEHSAIPDADLHQPKGAATADTKTVLVADGLGGTSWERQQLSDHAQMAVINNATATVVAAAVDSTLNTDTDYVKITAGWSQTHGVGITFNVDELVVPVDGHYQIHFWADVLIPTINNFVGIKYAVNDTAPYSTQKIKSQSSTANDYRNLSGSGYLTLTAGDTVSVYIAASKADNLVVEEAGMVLYLAHEV